MDGLLVGAARVGAANMAENMASSTCFVAAVARSTRGKGCRRSARRRARSVFYAVGGNDSTSDSGSSSRGGGTGGGGGSGKPPKEPMYYDPNKAERPPWADALWIIFRFHVVFGMIYGFYAHLTIKNGLWTAEDIVPITGRRRRLITTLQMLGDKDWDENDIDRQLSMNPGGLQGLATQVLARIADAAKASGLPELDLRVVLVPSIKGGQQALSVLDSQGNPLILVDENDTAPSLYPAIISHEAAHHYASHINEIQTLLYAFVTPFNAFKPMAPGFVFLGLWKSNEYGEEGEPGKGLLSAPRVIKRGLDLGVKLMFLDRMEIFENAISIFLNGWKQKVELEADQIGSMLCARAGLNPRTYDRLFDRLDKDVVMHKFIEKLPLLSTHPMPAQRRKQMVGLAETMQKEYTPNRASRKLEDKLVDVENNLGMYLLR